METLIQEQIIETDKAPCDKPCGDTPCSEKSGPCTDEHGNLVPCCKDKGPNLIQKMMLETFSNALSLCLDEVEARPKRILHIGGTRQREFVRYFALLLPGTVIDVLDPDAQAVKDAEEAIQCRLKFVHADIESMPFDNNAYDLVIGHNLFEYVKDWSNALGEIDRVTNGNMILTRHSPFAWSWMKHLPGVEKGFKDQGVIIPNKMPTRNEFYRILNHFGQIKYHSAPWPWHMWLIGLSHPEYRTQL